MALSDERRAQVGQRPVHREGLTITPTPLSHAPRRTPAVPGPASVAGTILAGVLAAVLLASTACQSSQRDRPELVVGVAASLRPVLTELAERFERQHEAAVTVAAGASGALSAQIRQGAPMDLFISADQRFTAELASDGLLDPSSLAGLARGEMIAVTAMSGPIGDVVGLLRRDSVQRVALANPGVAPYGAAARRYLIEAGVWNAIEAKVVYGENAAQAFQFVASGNADVGFVPRALVLASPAADVRTLAPLPPEASASLIVTAGIPAAAEREGLARRFLSFLAAADSLTVWERTGYRGGPDAGGG